MDYGRDITDGSLALYELVLRRTLSYLCWSLDFSVTTHAFSVSPVCVSFPHRWHGRPILF